ncbi:hypothetical protein SDC9_123943 [bioreactor metagenome]|uniref:Uncharacterized protein n=1 Tax=bioreactor metagenome TaxID=1076179 RepID=A0A645CJ33_9ZZZZ
MVVYGAVALIGHALADQPLNHGDDLGDVLGRPGMNRSRPDAQRLCVPVVFRDESVAQFLDRHTLFVGPSDHLIVDIRKVLHKGHLVPFVLQIPPQHVKDYKGTRVADVKIIVHRRPAGVNAHLTGLDRHKLFLFSALAVVDLHGVTSSLHFLSLRNQPRISASRSCWISTGGISSSTRS